MRKCNALVYGEQPTRASHASDFQKPSAAAESQIFELPHAHLRRTIACSKRLDLSRNKVSQHVEVEGASQQKHSQRFGKNSVSALHQHTDARMHMTDAKLCPFSQTIIIRSRDGHMTATMKESATCNRSQHIESRLRRGIQYLPEIPKGAEWPNIYPRTWKASVDESEGINTPFKSPAETLDLEHILRQGHRWHEYHITAPLRGPEAPTISSSHETAVQSCNTTNTSFSTPLTVQMTDICDRTPLEKYHNETLWDAEEPWGIQKELDERDLRNPKRRKKRRLAPNLSQEKGPTTRPGFEGARLVPELDQKRFLSRVYKVQRDILRRLLPQAHYWSIKTLEDILRQKERLETLMEEKYRGSFQEDKEGVLEFSFFTNDWRSVSKKASVLGKTGQDISKVAETISVDDEDTPPRDTIQASSPLQDLRSSPLTSKSTKAGASLELSLGWPVEDPHTSPFPKVEKPENNTDVRIIQLGAEEDLEGGVESALETREIELPLCSADGRIERPENGGVLQRAHNQMQMTPFDSTLGRQRQYFLHRCFKMRTAICQALDKIERDLETAWSAKDQAKLPSRRLLSATPRLKSDSMRSMDFLAALRQEQLHLEGLIATMLGRMKDIEKDQGRLAEWMQTLCYGQLIDAAPRHRQQANK